MWRIIKAEIEYNKFFASAIIALPVLFLFFALADIRIFSEVFFLKKYFWSTLLGIGAYAVVFAFGALRLKEKRDRMHAVLPVKLKLIAKARMVLGIAPLIFITAVLEFFRPFAEEEWNIFINRTEAQLGMLFVIISIILIVSDLRFVLDKRSEGVKLILSSFAVIIMGGFSIVLVYFVTKYHLSIYKGWGTELIFIIWDLVMMLFAPVVFFNRKSFLK